MLLNHKSCWISSEIKFYYLFLDRLFLLWQNQLNVAWVGHVSCNQERPDESVIQENQNKGATMWVRLRYLKTYDWFFREHGKSFSFVLQPDSLGCVIWRGHQHPNLSPEIFEMKMCYKHKGRETKKRFHALIKGMVLTSALLSAFLSKSRTNWADFAGQRPWPLECLFLAWAVRPTPLQKRVKGIACLWAITSSRYLFALINGSFLMACAVSRVFCFTYARENQTLKWEPINNKEKKHKFEIKTRMWHHLLNH